MNKSFKFSKILYKPKERRPFCVYMQRVSNSLRYYINLDSLQNFVNTNESFKFSKILYKQGYGCCKKRGDAVSNSLRYYINSIYANPPSCVYKVSNSLRYYINEVVLCYVGVTSVVSNSLRYYINLCCPTSISPFLSCFKFSKILYKLITTVAQSSSHIVFQIL